MRRLVALVVVVIFTGCIRTVEERELIVERIIDPAPEARALPRCPALPALGDTSGWRREPGATIALPPGFVLDPEGRDRFGPRHGGTFWKDAAGRTFRSINGHWGVSEQPNACHAYLAGALAVIVLGADRTGYWIDAWPVSRSAMTTPRFDAFGSSPDDQQLFLRILQTYRRRDSDE